MAKMSNVYTSIINAAYSKIYAMGDSGLDYMDGHCAMDNNLMHYFYNDSLSALSPVELARLANILQTIAADAEFDLETF